MTFVVKSLILKLDVKALEEIYLKKENLSFKFILNLISYYYFLMSYFIHLKYFLILFKKMIG